MNTTAEKTQGISRPPVVVILGHVDHGKTSILDRIRETKVAAKEAGGITQHIGAYQAEHNGKIITFLDTPGHEAFTAIRSRGATVADIAILVVAADEGVKPQTKEAIQIIQRSKIPYIVAINKIDKEGANPQRMRQELAEHEVFVEGYGGQVPVIELSAKTGEGINELLEMILLVSELEELTASLDTPAEAVIIESHKDNRRGVIATALIQSGRLNVGDWLSAGATYAKVKSLENFMGKVIKSAGPSEPCLILGWESVPSLGQQCQVVPDKATAERQALAASSLGTGALFQDTNDPTATTVKKIAYLVIKADVNSSLEAIDQVLRTIHSDEVKYKIMSYGIGTINDTDVQNAKVSGAYVIGFHVGVDESARQRAERETISVQNFDIIYELVEAVRSAMSELLEPEIRRTPLGKIKVLALFKSDSRSQIVGGKVIQGKVVRGSMIDVLRGNGVIMTGKLGQLQHNKADVTEVAEGNELGLRFDPIKIEAAPLPTMPGRPGQASIIVGDLLDIYQEERIKRSL